MTISRRDFLRTSAALSLGFAGLRCSYSYAGAQNPVGEGFGPLIDDPKDLLALPEGFEYTVFSRVGETMSDGFFVPGLHDGMATFPGPDGLTLLVRNHELNASAEPITGPFGPANELYGRLDPSLLYDPGQPGEDPALGGTTTLLFDTRTQRLVDHRLSLVGTLRNCAGGPTPWGSWITCEETVVRAGARFRYDHGYNFEVPARWEGGVTRAVPLKAMGRFNHEAVCVHPPTGIVYQTEDDGEGLLYRFLPNRPGELARGGRLQALAVRGRPSLDTRNWAGTEVPAGALLEVEWIDVDDVESPGNDLRFRGFEDGAARFARGEGMWWSDGFAWFACTNGGPKKKGQIWRYRPGPHEGTARESEAPGTLELFIEPADGTLVENADNLTVTPWGDLIVCEDGTGDDYLVLVGRNGEISKFGHNMASRGEFAGSCFSFDGSTLFVNMQAEGLTVAIQGPWERGHDG